MHMLWIIKFMRQNESLGTVGMILRINHDEMPCGVICSIHAGLLYSILPPQLANTRLDKNLCSRLHTCFFNSVGEGFCEGIWICYLQLQLQQYLPGIHVAAQTEQSKQRRESKTHKES